MVKCVLEDGVKLGWDWKERWAKVVIVVGGGALELEGGPRRGRGRGRERKRRSMGLRRGVRKRRMSWSYLMNHFLS